MHTPQVAISRLTPDACEAAFSLACQVFVDGSVLHQALGIPLDEYRAYFRGPFTTLLAHDLSLVAVDERDGTVLGCLLARDYAEPAPGDAPVPEKLEPLAALLHALEQRYRAIRSIAPGRCMLVDMAIVSPHAAGRGIYRRLRESAHRLGREAGFEQVVGELSSAATQHVCVNGFGHRVRAEIAYASFEHRGRRPFAAIREPVSIQLVEGDLIPSAT